MEFRNRLYSAKVAQRDLHDDLSEDKIEGNRETGLRFRVLDAPHARVRVPYFYSLGSGVQAMDSLAQVFNIPDFIWHQRA